MEQIDCTLVQSFDINAADYNRAVRYYYMQTKRMPDGLNEVLQQMNGEQVSDILLEPLLDLFEIGSHDPYPWVLIQNQAPTHIGAVFDPRGRVPHRSVVTTLITMLTLGLTDQSQWTGKAQVQKASSVIREILKELMMESHGMLGESAKETEMETEVETETESQGL